MKNHNFLFIYILFINANRIVVEEFDYNLYLEESNLKELETIALKNPKVDLNSSKLIKYDKYKHEKCIDLIILIGGDGTILHAIQGF